MEELMGSFHFKAKELIGLPEKEDVCGGQALGSGFSSPLLLKPHPWSRSVPSSVFINKSATQPHSFITVDGCLHATKAE